MANVLDLRRRIRSVKNTRQITKAMKMVSAAKLRRAQERALAARPYARMITSVLESLTRRVEIFDEETGNLRHPLFATRAGEAGAADRHQRRQGLCRRLQRQHPQDGLPVHRTATRTRRSTSRPWAARAATMMRRRYPAAVYTEQTDDHGTRTRPASARRRSKSPATIRECC
jgi:F-type H+-transporting ATPase subunit gamma